MLINGGLGELREGTDRYYRYDDDREYGVEKRFTCVVDGEEVAFSGWGKTVILPKSEALAITGLLAGGRCVKNQDLSKERGNDSLPGSGGRSGRFSGTGSDCI